MNDHMPLLDVQQLSKFYGQHTALDDLSLTVEGGVIFGLLGPNGAGKSTFLRLLNRIIFPDKGSIHILGQPLGEKHILDIGYLPEERGLFKKMKVGEQLVYLGRLRGFTRSDAINRAKEKLSLFEAEQWWNKPLESLSKGMQQKVQFAATILHGPRIIILDEPFSGFDPLNADVIKSHILSLKEKGCTIILSTHRMESVESLCDEVALIHKARLRLLGKTHHIKQDFRKQEYEVLYKGILPESIENATVLETATTPYGSKVLLKLHAENSTSPLILSLIQHVEILSFREVLPDFNTIFIETIQKEDE
jgi:ABC-2 type transport system ATP-binding protein